MDGLSLNHSGHPPPRAGADFTDITRTSSKHARHDRGSVHRRVREILLQRGVHLLKDVPSEGGHLYVFSAPTGRVGSAIWVYRDRGLLNAFTTGSAGLEDNFDPIGTMQWPVENFTFGYGKLCCEAECLRRMLRKPLQAMSLYQAENQANKFMSDEEKVRISQVIDDLREGRTEEFEGFFIDLLIKGLGDTARYANEIVAKRDLPDGDDPVYQLVPRMESEIKDFKELVLIRYGRYKAPNTLQEALHTFLHIKAILVDSLPQLHPKIAKMALGRGALFSLIRVPWEGAHSRLHMWTVCFARLYLLLTDSHMAYTFFMLNAFGKSDEWSKFDDLWAQKRKPLTPDPEKRINPGALCDLVHSGDGGVVAAACASQVVQAMSSTAPLPHFLGVGSESAHAAAKAKLLGVANDWVVEFLRNIANGEPIGSSLSPELAAEMNRAKTFLSEAGWEAGFNTFLHGKHYSRDNVGVFDPPPLSKHIAALIRTATLEDAERFVEDIAFDEVGMKRHASSQQRTSPSRY